MAAGKFQRGAQVLQPLAGPPEQFGGLRALDQEVGESAAGESRSGLGIGGGAIMVPLLVLMLGGLAVTGTGVYLAVWRIKRDLTFKRAPPV